MLKKKLSISLIVLLFIISSIFFIPHEKAVKVIGVKTPACLLLTSGEFCMQGFDTFDSAYTEKNKSLAKKLNITEKEVFLLGNLGKNWATNLMRGRQVLAQKDKDLVYFKYSYLEKFKYSGYCLLDGNPFFEDVYQRRLNEVRTAKFTVLDLDNYKIYKPENAEVKTLKNFIVLRYSHLPSDLRENRIKKADSVPNYVLDKGGVKIFFSDSTTKYNADRNCSSSICKEILSNINLAKNTIDMAIYGYSSVPVIEAAIKNAQARGVKIRLVYDLNSSGENIYPDTSVLTGIIPHNISDRNSNEAKNIMHNKFYIFDDKILIAGSANLSHTDMSGFNSNSMVVVNSEELAKIYKQEFEQMFGGKFHNEKVFNPKNKVVLNGTEIHAYFSPQDKAITNAVLPLIRQSKRYIYIPTFVITEKRTVEELIKAKQRGVDVRMIIDALSASNKHSKHQVLRDGGVWVKAENYAGKMHSKSMIVDDEYTIVGSMNFSSSGEKRNDENLLVIRDSATAKFYKENFLHQWNRIDDKWLKFTPRAEGKDSIGSCSDGIDNNYDGLTDLQDSACK